MADQGGSSAVTVMRDYRKGNWTVNETMILIEAKKMDDQRRMKRSGENEGRSKPAELRWKWVEDYCWRKGCLRSQNQCNDKWDNLMRDYKKVRDYERRLLSERGDSGDHDGGPSSSSSYWMIDKNERKEKNLPSNMLRQIYEGLVEVVERKGVGTTSATAAAAAHQRVMSGGGGGLGLGSIPNIGYVVDRIEPPLPPLLQHHNPSPVSVAALPPPPPLPPPPSAPQPPQPPQQPQQPQQPHIAYPQPLPSLDSDTSEYSDSPAKRRRRGGGEGTSGGTTTASGSSSIEVGSAISKSASIIAEAIQASEEREERRHRDLLSLLERRLKIEESKTEVNREGINGLVDAINNLANSILALASDRTQTPPQ